MFIKWDGVFCPCCGYRLRIGPRNIKDKAKLRIKQKEMQESKNKKSIMLTPR
jgi:hypothetical protein